MTALVNHKPDLGIEPTGNKNFKTKASPLVLPSQRPKILQLSFAFCKQTTSYVTKKRQAQIQHSFWVEGRVPPISNLTWIFGRLPLTSEKWITTHRRQFKLARLKRKWKKENSMRLFFTNQPLKNNFDCLQTRSCHNLGWSPLVQEVPGSKPAPDITCHANSPSHEVDTGIIKICPAPQR